MSSSLQASFSRELSGSCVGDVRLEEATAGARSFDDELDMCALLLQ